MWYPQSFMTLRMGLFFGSSMISGILSGVISTAISSSLHTFLGLEGWRWIFIIEGALTVLFAFVLLFLLSDYPDTSSFLSYEEKEAVQSAIGSKSKGPGVDRGAILLILKRPSTYVFMVTMFCQLTSMYCFSFAFVPCFSNR
jgi:MFS family permease